MGNSAGKTLTACVLTIILVDLIYLLTWLLQSRYHQAKMSVQERAAKVAAVVESLERDMELLCVTGVEDKLHDGVRTTLELLRNAGIKVSPFTLSIRPMEFLLFSFVLSIVDVPSESVS